MTTFVTPHRWIALAGIGSVLAVLIFAGPRVAAFERYNDGCNICHGAFSGPMSPTGTVFPGDSKHIMHRGSSYMDTSCSLCHSEGDDHNPYTGSSAGTANNPGVGCTGCHGRDYGGAIGNSGVGLRAHHFTNGVDVCFSCHGNEPQPLPENVAPTYYGTPDTNVDDPCNSDPLYLENWSIGDTRGLDNDGDNLYDGDDPDCDGGCPGGGDCTVYPHDFNTFRGFHDSGTLDDVLDSDDVDLCHDLGITIFPSEAPITLDFDGTLPTGSPASLDVTFESSANTPGLELTISFWNYNTNSWEVVGTAAQGFNTDTVRTFAATPADHVEAGTGNVKTRYEVRQVGIIFQFPWTDCIDQVFWTFE